MLRIKIRKTRKKKKYKMDEKREIRNTVSPLQASEGEENEKRTVEGYAFLFGVSSDGLSFEEVIEPGAADGIIEKSDVFATLDHGGILARSKYGKGSLQLVLDDKGLLYRFEAPKTALGDQLLENIRRGEIDQSSFCFEVEDVEWVKKPDGTYKRSIKKFKRLHDVSPVYNAAYSKTSVYLRGKEVAEEELKSRKESELNTYYQQAMKSLNI